jgi:MFS family permease
MDCLGRKTTCQLSCVPLVVAWILVCLAQSVEILYVGRLLAGVGGGKWQSIDCDLEREVC